jgi:excisionase family DNA binding protein
LARIALQNPDTRLATLVCMNTQTPTRSGTVLLSPADAAQLAQVSRNTIYREIERGALPARHVGRQLRIDPADFRAYLERDDA